MPARGPSWPRRGVSGREKSDARLARRLVAPKRGARSRKLANRPASRALVGERRREVAYSDRSAIDGFTTDARRAGIAFANAATVNNVAVAVSHATGSTKLTPYSAPATAFAAPSDNSVPIATPMAAMPKP